MPTAIPCAHTTGEVGSDPGSGNLTVGERTGSAPQQRLKIPWRQASAGTSTSGGGGALAECTGAGGEGAAKWRPPNSERACARQRALLLQPIPPREMHLVGSTRLERRSAAKGRGRERSRSEAVPASGGGPFGRTRSGAQGGREVQRRIASTPAIILGDGVICKISSRRNLQNLQSQKKQSFFFIHHQSLETGRAAARPGVQPHLVG